MHPPQNVIATKERSMRRPTLSVLGILTASLAAAGPAPAKEPPAPTFSKDIAPIIFQNCVSCHRPGQAAPFALQTCHDVKKRGELIAHVTELRIMPPWKAARGDVAFRGERRLSDDE